MRRPCRKAGLVVVVSLQAPVPAGMRFRCARWRDMLPPAAPPMLEAGADVAPPAQRNMQLRRQHRIIADAALRQRGQGQAAVAPDPGAVAGTKAGLVPVIGMAQIAKKQICGAAHAHRHRKGQLRQMPGKIGKQGLGQIRIGRERRDIGEIALGRHDPAAQPHAAKAQLGRKIHQAAVAVPGAALRKAQRGGAPVCNAERGAKARHGQVVAAFGMGQQCEPVSHACAQRRRSKVRSA